MADAEGNTAMTAQQLVNHLESAIAGGYGDYDIIFMDGEKFPHSVEAVSPDHSCMTLDLLPYQNDSNQPTHMSAKNSI